MAEEIKDPYSGNVITPATPIPQISVNPQTIYSASNIASATTAPVARPDLSDPYKMYDTFMNSADIQAGNKELQDITAQYNKALSTSRTQQTAIENLPQALNVIRGEQAQASRLSADTLASLSEAKLAKQSYIDTLKQRGTDLYNIAQSERSKLQDLIAQTGGKAKISYADSYENALQKATKYIEKKAEKDSIKQLYQQTFGSSGKGLSSKEMEKKLKKVYKSKKDYENQVKSLELQTKQIQLSKLKKENSSTTGLDKAWELWKSLKGNNASAPAGTSNPTNWSSIINGSLSGLRY